MRRLEVDLNSGGRLPDGRGITWLSSGDRRNGNPPRDLAEGEGVLLADYDDFPDGSPAWIEIRATIVAEDDGWAAVWSWDDRTWVPRR